MRFIFVISTTDMIIILNELFKPEEDHDFSYQHIVLMFVDIDLHKLKYDLN